MKVFKKKALFICGNLPYPIVSGGRKREFQLLSDIGKYFDVELLCITREIVSDMKNSKYLDKYVEKINLLPANAVSESVLSNKIAIENLFKRFHTGKVTDWLTENMKRFDIIHVERSALIPCSFLKNSVPFVISEQSIESKTINQVLTSGILNHNDKARVESYYESMIAHEEAMWESACKIITITENDAREIKLRISNADKVFIVPPRLSNKKRPSSKKINDRKVNLIYLGNFNYFPNIVSLNKIFKEIVPILNKMKIDYHFKIIGTGADKIKNGFKNNRCEIIGYTQDLAEYWEWAHISLLPIYYGGGLKVKILDSLKNRVPVITTNSGLNGFEHYKNIFVYPCENSIKMALLIKYFVENPKLFSKVATDLATENLRWDLSGKNHHRYPLYSGFLKELKYDKN